MSAEIPRPDAQATAAVPPGPPRKRDRWKRAALVLLVFLLGVLIGWLLAPGCPQCPGGSGGDGKEHGTNAKTTGRGAPVGVGPGSGSGDSLGGRGNASGDTQGKGYEGGGNGAAGDAGGGGNGNGTTVGGNGDFKRSKDADDTLHSAVIKQAQGLDPDGDGTAPAGQSGPTTKTLSAPDYTYDRTGLPRYPNVQQVESALSYRNPADTQSWRSSVGATTGDAFDTVVGWYKAQLPAGWQATVMGDMQQLARQASMQNIGRMLMGAAQTGSDGGSSDSAALASAPPPTDPGQRARVAIFKAPVGTAGQPGVMVVQHGDQPVVVMLQNRSAP